MGDDYYRKERERAERESRKSQKAHEAAAKARNERDRLVNDALRAIAKRKY